MNSDPSRISRLSRPASYRYGYTFPFISYVDGFRLLRLGITGMLLILGLAGRRAEAGVPEYAVNVLGSITGGTGGGASAINASGEAAGSVDVPNSHDAAVWTGTTPTNLGTLGSYGCQALGINDSGVAVGFSYTTGYSNLQALEWTGTTMTLLGTLGGAESSANGINDSGLVVGTASTSGGAAIDAVEWTGTTPTILGSVGGSFSEAFGINNSGEIVGFSNGLYNGYTQQLPVEWTGTVPTILQPLSASSEAEAINSAGVAVGMSNSQAVEWTGTTAAVIPTFGGNDNNALGINSSGQVVGFSGTFGVNFTGFLYTGGSTYNIVNLLVPGSGVTSFMAQAINDKGQIAGYGTIAGTTYGMVLSPVPEPGSAGLLALGGCGLASWLFLRKVTRQARKSSN